MGIEERRRGEHAKYERAYEAPNYHMGDQRRADAIDDLKALPLRGSYLDISTGAGEMIDEAARLGFSPARGTEIVPALIDGERVIRAEVHDLPFADHSFDVVTMFDVIEHLLPGDDELACCELARVAVGHIILSANNRNSFSGTDDLHINKRPYEEWDRLFRLWFGGEVTWLKGQRHYHSQTWRVDF